MKIERTKLPGVVMITPDVYRDNRGYFMEAINKFAPISYIDQVNVSRSNKGVIRGLHSQKGTAKLVWVVQGAIYDVAYDPNTSQYTGGILSARNHKQLYIPEDFYHGFQALADNTIVCYAMSSEYSQKDEHGINPNRVKWPLEEQIISDKDKNEDSLPRK